jgi:hypothetical protein
VKSICGPCQVYATEEGRCVLVWKKIFSTHIRYSFPYFTGMAWKMQPPAWYEFILWAGDQKLTVAIYFASIFLSLF